MRPCPSQPYDVALPFTKGCFLRDLALLSKAISVVGPFEFTSLLPRKSSRVIVTTGNSGGLYMEWMGLLPSLLFGIGLACVVWAVAKLRQNRTMKIKKVQNDNTPKKTA
jgi:hypothetical protein